MDGWMDGWMDGQMNEKMENGKMEAGREDGENMMDIKRRRQSERKGEITREIRIWHQRTQSYMWCLLSPTVWPMSHRLHACA